jgi:putrescine transport system permease protein
MSDPASSPGSGAPAGGSLVRNGAGRLARHGRWLVYALPLIWLTLFFLLPFFFVLKISLAEAIIAQPPYTPLIAEGPDGGWSLQATLANFAFLLEDRLYVLSYLTSLRIALVSTVLCLLIGYPIAYAIARAQGRLQLVLLMLVILPFWTSFLIRVYAWKVLLQGGGVVNGALMGLGIIDAPLNMLYTEGAVYVGIVYSYLPFMILPLYAALARLDYSTVEAAMDLGCRPWQAFYKVTLPLSLPGIIAGSLLVFIPAVGEFVIPELLGGPDSIMIGRVLWNEFFANRDWPIASAVAIVMLLLLVLPIALLQNYRKDLREVDA